MHATACKTSFAARQKKVKPPQHGRQPDEAPTIQEAEPTADKNRATLRSEHTQFLAISLSSNSCKV